MISHGVLHNKMLHSMWACELASLGFCVFTLTHKDGTADYAQGVGHVDMSIETWDYWQRQAMLRYRTQEIVHLVNELSKPKALSVFGASWA